MRRGPGPNIGSSVAYACGCLAACGDGWMAWRSAPVLCSDIRRWEKLFRRAADGAALRRAKRVVTEVTHLTLSIPLPVPASFLPPCLSAEVAAALRGAVGGRDAGPDPRGRILGSGGLHALFEDSRRGTVRTDSPCDVVSIVQVFEPRLKDVLDDGRRCQKRFTLVPPCLSTPCPCLAMAAACGLELGQNRVKDGSHFAGPVARKFEYVPPNSRRPVGVRRVREEIRRWCAARGVTESRARRVERVVVGAVRPYVDERLRTELESLGRFRHSLPGLLKITVFDRKADQWGVVCSHLLRGVYVKHFSDSKYYVDAEGWQEEEATVFYGFRAGPPRPYIIPKWKDPTRGRPIVSYFQAQRKPRLRTVSRLLDRLLRADGRGPDVWAMTEAINTLCDGVVATDIATSCDFTRPAVGASDIVGMYTNVDRADCLRAVRVFLDEHWRFDGEGRPLKMKLKRRAVLWVGAESRSSRGAWSAAEMYSVIAAGTSSERGVESHGVVLRGAPHPAMAAGCGCGRVHPLMVCRWRNDTVFVQRIPTGCSGADWVGRLTGIYPTSLELEWSDGARSASGVVWTDLVVDVQ
eukprot:gene23256-biopygen23817